MRCFVAAWPSDPTRAALNRLLAALRADVPAARPMQPRNLHLTLAFIGDLEADVAQPLADAVHGLPIDAVPWTVDTLGWFPKARVAWAGGETTAALDRAVRAVREVLDARRVGYDHKPFVAHVTLFRDVRAFPASGPLTEPIAWATEHVALYAATRDDRGPVYRPV